MHILVKGQRRLDPLILILGVSLMLTACCPPKDPTASSDSFKATKTNSPVIPDDAIAFDYRSGGIYLRMKINDSITGSFLFDTGSDQLYLDSQFVAEGAIPVNMQSSKMIFGVGEGSRQVPSVSSVRLGLEDLYYDYTNVPVTNIRAISGDEIDGVFCIRLFIPYIVSINFDQSYLRIIKDTLGFRAPHDYDSLDIRYLGKTKTVIECEANINDSIQVSGYTILDLGSGGSLTLSSPIARENKLDNTISNKYRVSRKLGGYGGKTSSWYFRARNIKFGNTVINQPVMNYSTDAKGYLSYWGLLGLMGTKILERFNMIFDFYNHRFYFKPNTRFSNDYKGNMTGFNSKNILNDDQNRRRIYNVIEGSPADKAGIKVGDIITHIDGIAISEISVKERKRLVTQSFIPLLLRIERNGEIFQVNLRPQRII